MSLPENWTCFICGRANAGWWTNCADCDCARGHSKKAETECEKLQKENVELRKQLKEAKSIQEVLKEQNELVRKHEQLFERKMKEAWKERDKAKEELARTKISAKPKTIRF